MMINYRKLHVLISCFLLILIPCTVFAGAPKIEIKEYKIDLKHIKSGIVIRREVEITNSGTEELIIKKVRCTCDCLTATISSEKIMSEQSSIITFVLDTADVNGEFKKYIFIQSNDPNKPISRIIIKGVVVKNTVDDEKGKKDAE